MRQRIYRNALLLGFGMAAIGMMLLGRAGIGKDGNGMRRGRIVGITGCAVATAAVIGRIASRRSGNADR